MSFQVIKFYNQATVQTFKEWKSAKKEENPQLSKKKLWFPHKSS